MTLRDVVEGDLPIFYENQRDPLAHRMAAVPPRDHQAFLLHWRTKVLGDPAVAKQTIVAGGVVAGNVVAWDARGMRLIGYWVGRAHWGGGIATGALQEFLAAHETRRPLHAEVAVANLGSRRVLEKCGFAPEGPESTGDDGVVEQRMRLDR